MRIPCREWSLLLFRTARLVCVVSPLFFTGCVSMMQEYRDAQACIASGDIPRAVELLEQVKVKAVSEESREKIQSRIDKLKEQVVTEYLRDAENKKGASPTIVSIDAAIRCLGECPYKDDSDRIASMLVTYAKDKAGLREKCRKKIEESSAADKAGDWAAALAALADAAGMDPSNTEYALRRKRVLDARDTRYAANVQAAVKASNLDEAMRQLAIAEKLVPGMDNVTLVRVRDEVDGLRQYCIGTKVDEYMGQNKFYQAYSLLLMAKNQQPEKMRTIRKKGALFYLGKARTEKAGGPLRLGYAYCAAVKAYELDKNEPGVFEIHRDCADAMDRLIDIKIAISGFDSPVKESGAGPQFSDALIAYLVDCLPYGIQILERSKIDKLLNEKGRELKELSEELKVEMFIVGNVSSIDVEHQKSENEVTEIVQTSMKQQANPQYAAEYIQFERQYGPDTTRWPYVPVATTEVPQKEIIKYKRGSELVRGLMVVSVRIFETTKGAITVAKEFKESISDKDDYRDAVPVANVAGDPLVLKTDTEIKESLRERLVKRVAEVVVRSYEHRERRFFETADWYAGRRETEKAVLELAKGLYYCQMDVENLADKTENEAYRKLRTAALIDYTE